MVPLKQTRRLVVKRLILSAGVLMSSNMNGNLWKQVTSLVHPRRWMAAGKGFWNCSAPSQVIGSMRCCWKQKKHPKPKISRTYCKILSRSARVQKLLVKIVTGINSAKLHLEKALRIIFYIIQRPKTFSVPNWCISNGIGLNVTPLVIVSDVLDTTHGLSWESMVMWHAFHVKNEKLLDVSAINCLDWYEVDTSIHLFFEGYS